jgi:acyl-[acyl-carrier-protein]-phospholipid O-acyltransferase/long-chain-fatty-acid--[acyl-carrier-protein] ligase
VLLALGFSLPQLFGIMGLIGLVVSVYICALLPDYLLRSVLQTLLRILFKVRVRGSENFYRSGRKVVLIANHVSLLDGVLMAAFMPERLTFAITSAWTQRWFMPIVRLLADFYPLDPSSPLSLRKLIELIKSGRKVMIFPEGRITVTGKVMQVYDGAALTALKSGAKILPVRIDGAEYSTLSYVTDKLKCRAFPTVTLSIGEAFRPDCKEKHGRHGLWLYHLMNETAVKTAEIPTGLYRALEGRRAMIGNNQVILRTADGSSLTLKQLLKHAKRLAETMRKPLAGMSTIGLFEENPLTFVVCLTALDYLGKTIVLYDVAHVAEQVQSKRADCVIGTTPTDALQDVFYPLPRLTLKAVFASNRPSAESAKIVVFKNGQVQTYTMRQLLSGVRQLETVLAPTRQNKIVNTVAPYGTDNLVSGVLLPLLNGAELQFTAHLSPRLISHVCYDMSADVLIGTPQMLAQIQNEASQFDFFSLKYAFAVGDNVSDALAEGWLKAFGVRIMTQLTPVASIVPIAVNTPFYYRFGTFGQVLPLARADNLVRDADGFVLGINSSAASEDR